MGKVLSLNFIYIYIFHFFTSGHFPYPLTWGQPGILWKSLWLTSIPKEQWVCDSFPLRYFIIFKIMWVQATGMLPKYYFVATLTHIRHKMRSYLLATDDLSLTFELEPVGEPMCCLRSSMFPQSPPSVLWTPMVLGWQKVFFILFILCQCHQLAAETTSHVWWSSSVCVYFLPKYLRPVFFFFTVLIFRLYLTWWGCIALVWFSTILNRRWTFLWLITLLTLHMGPNPPLFSDWDGMVISWPWTQWL